ncbi:hypothetical protein DL93DRAFT_2097955 [Clavulina sp. PMI_390]|nr:hypothetical protein DL93DRAFT_2097955 [Clavulina sp. PMI_390]
MTADNKIEVDSREHPIVGVTVYQSNRAIVQRRFPVDVKPGQNDIAIKFLSSFLEGDSIRVEAETTSYSQILTVFDVVYSAPNYSTTVATKADTPEVEALREEKSEKEMHLQTLERDEALLNGYSDSLRDGRVEHATSDSLLSFMGMRLEKQKELWKEKKQLQKEIKALGTKISSMGYVHVDEIPSTLRSGVTVVLLAEESGPVELVVSYDANCPLFWLVVNQASWTSLYDVRADLAGTSKSSKSTEVAGPTVKLQYRASITQSTGEDWKGVALTLSTASPLLGTEVPKVQPWRIAAWKPYERPQWTPGLRSLPPPSAQLSAAPTRSRRLPTSPDRGSDLMDLVGGAPPPPPVSFDAGPDIRVNEGPSSVFLDGNFVAKSTVPNVSPSESFACSLGVDPSVRITFHPQSKISTTTGGTGFASYIGNNNPKMNVTSFKQRITIKNTRANTAIVKLVVQDRVPMSEDSRIKVTISQPNEGAIGPAAGIPAEESGATAASSGTARSLKAAMASTSKDKVLVDQISNNVLARWAQKEEEGGGSGGARGDGVIEWIITDLKDSVDLNLAFEVTCPADVRFVDA